MTVLNLEFLFFCCCGLFISLALFPTNLGSFCSAVSEARFGYSLTFSCSLRH